jgi:hypothetical protein
MVAYKMSKEPDAKEQENNNVNGNRYTGTLSSSSSVSRLLLTPSRWCSLFATSIQNAPRVVIEFSLLTSR